MSAAALSFPKEIKKNYCNSIRHLASMTAISRQRAAEHSSRYIAKERPNRVPGTSPMDERGGQTEPQAQVRSKSQHSSLNCLRSIGSTLVSVSERVSLKLSMSSANQIRTDSEVEATYYTQNARTRTNWTQLRHKQHYGPMK